MDIVTQTEDNFKPLIDFHSHILPCIDDGAKNIKQSVELLKIEISHGVRTIVLTPHFYPESDDFFTFLQKRKDAFAILQQTAGTLQFPLKFILGAEVKFSPKLLEYDLDSLCIENTKCILLEFSLLHYLPWTRDIIFKLLNAGYTPIIAHAERYSNLPEDELYNLVNMGAYIQVNSSSLLNKTLTKKINSMINQNLVHLWGTDSHSIDKRPPSFKEAKEYLNKKYGVDFFTNCQLCAARLLANESPITLDPIKEKIGIVKKLCELVKGKQ